MRKPKDIFLGEFNYPLPDERIAGYPLTVRDRSRLLVYKNGNIDSAEFRTLPYILNRYTHLVFNNTKVIHARLLFQKITGAQVEIFCLEPMLPFDYQVNFSASHSVTWKCIVGNSKKWKDEILVAEKNNRQVILKAERLKKEEGYESILFSWQPAEKCFSEILEIFGRTPIPPYLHREAEESDSIAYQTVYSKHEGSVAAPTAGLHFTEALMDHIKHSGIEITNVTLHVGAGTFVPVKVENGLDHVMHTERFQVSRKSIRHLANHHNHITSVGTTSCRTLESLYWIGVKILSGCKEEQCRSIGQFESYTLTDQYTRKEALTAIAGFLEEQNQELFFGSTSIMISPGYDFKMTDCLITNFHQPSSTLLMLIAAFVGDDWKRIYTYALENDFRFLSYGDSSILFRE